MSFIGIVVKKKREEQIKKLEEIVYPNEIIYLSNDTISNVRNVKFETVVLQDEIPKEDKFLKIAQNCEYLVLNSEKVKWDEQEKGNMRSVITYGYHQKDTVTFSSLTEDGIQICLQRNIKKQNGEWIEPQEIQLNREKNESVDLLLTYGTLEILYQKEKNNCPKT